MRPEREAGPVSPGGFRVGCRRLGVGRGFSKSLTRCLMPGNREGNTGGRGDAVDSVLDHRVFREHSES